ncbi:MAG TPA: LLM class flavin-dependent oxidoreductase [Acidimicrobiales bacterium]|nr:LLM class flavin-dependent oxidoreductase [Acidimicrobiales bacterium]
MSPVSGSPRLLARTEKGMSYGVLIPHFGEAANAKRIINAGVLAEEAGLEAVWVRDHLLWEPHGMEGTNRTFVEGLTVLAAIASRTTRINLGTAVLIPIRWPLKLAQDLASLSFMSDGRVVAGLGLGSGQAELGAAGFKRSDRKKIFVETCEILQQVWNDNGVSFDGRMFSFENVSIEPKPVKHLPLWYGGTTEISVRNAVDHCEGWMPGRIPVATLDARIKLLDELAASKGKTVTKAIIPLVKIDHDRNKARSDIDISALAGSSEASKTWVLPPGGFNTLDDLLGIVLAGTPDEVVEQIAMIADYGIDHFVFDLRLQDDRFEEVLELIGSEVMPALRDAGI